jgi:hypothetical protein
MMVGAMKRRPQIASLLALADIFFFNVFSPFCEMKSR